MVQVLTDIFFLLHHRLDKEKNGYVASDQLLYAL